MYSSLDRLIDLAKKTGDNLIIHDPLEGRDMVIMSVEKYEDLLEPQECTCEHEDYDMFDPELDDVFEDHEWHRAGEIMEDRYNFTGVGENLETDNNLFEQEELSKANNYFREFEETPAAVDLIKKQEISFDFESGDNSQPEPEIEIEDIPFDPPMPESEKIPFSSEKAGEMDWEEEPLPEEEPVFLEEPV